MGKLYQVITGADLPVNPWRDDRTDPRRRKQLRETYDEHTEPINEIEDAPDVGAFSGSIPDVSPQRDDRKEKIDFNGPQRRFERGGWGDPRAGG